MTQQKFLKKALFLAFIFLGLGIVSAQNTLQGTVKNSEGNAEQGVLITLSSSGLSTSTDSNGKYIINNVPLGAQVVQVEQEGYESIIEDVTVNAGDNTVDFSLSKMAKKLDEVVVTGVSNPKASINTSISISTLKTKDINNASPRTTAEIFRTIPGVRSESSGGEGNSNITVRGVPVSAGGSRYLLIQEDGLPVLQFGDVAFGTQDQFLRFDNTVSRIEALRGGSASILATNSPAGIINFISKTGEKEGGSLVTSFGLNYKNFRTDFEYGAPIGNNLTFHIGGFYRTGDGPRKTGYTSNNGGQLKFNVTKKFNSGYVRFYAKFLDDRAAAYMPMPMKVSGTNASPTWGSVNNYDALTGALQTPNLLFDRTMGGDGKFLDSDVSDGMHSISQSLGAELSLNFGEGWKLLNNARMSFNKGQFLAPFPANVGSFSSIISSVSGYSSAVYAGTNTAVNQNANYMLIHLFNTKLNNFNNYANNLNLSKKWNNVKLNLGLYKALQNINMSWHWNSYLMEVNDDNARMIDVRNASGQSLSPNGLLAYGVPAWGNCCNRNYNTKYDITAPYAQIEIEANDKLNFDLGVRYDMGNVSGNFAGGNGQTATIDMNQNGSIEPNETAVATVGNNLTAVNYEYDIFSYSAGANFKLNAENAVFARISSGGSASADRILFSGYNYTNSDDAALDAVKVNTVNQIEVGYKLRKSNYYLNATFFNAKTVESNYEATKQRKVDNTYQSMGIELDGFYKLSDAFDLKAGITYTKAEITDAIDPTIEGNTPRRLPDFMYSIAPNYNRGKFSAGVMFVGATKSFAQDSNKLVMNGYVIANPYLTYKLIKGLDLMLNANNIFNSLAVTEVEEGSITENTDNIVRGRSLPGTSYSLSIKYNF